jgi:hypothetical protein
VRLHHRRFETVVVPFAVWVEDSAGRVVAGRRSEALMMHYGDVREAQLELTIPADTAAGHYRVLAGVGQMQQGVARAVRPLQVGEN